MMAGVCWRPCRWPIQRSPSLSSTARFMSSAVIRGIVRPLRRCRCTTRPPTSGRSLRRCRCRSIMSWRRAPMARFTRSAGRPARPAIRDKAGFVNTVYEYDPAANRWTAKAPMPTRRGGGAAAVVDGKIYVVGGRPPGGADFAVYDRESRPLDDAAQLADAAKSFGGGRHRRQDLRRRRSLRRRL